MNKLTTLLLISAVSFAAPVMAADTDTADDVKADVGAIHKDNAALNKDADQLAKHRDEKADAKAKSDYVTQAGKSVAIGADKTMIKEKEAEKKVDKKILEHHQKKLNESANSDKEDSDK